MKREIFVIFLIVLFYGSLCIGNEPLVNQDLRGLYVRSIEKMLRLRSEEIDLATAVLIISEQWSDNVHGRRYLIKLDDMAYELRERLREKDINTNYKAVAVINEYLFEELGFKSVTKANDPNDLFLHTVLDRKKGYCLSLSVLYLALGERLGLPLYGVVVPGHFFVRYDDGKIKFNIETTNEGKYAKDSHYIDKFKVPQNGGIYLSSLNKRQTLGCFFNNLGNTYYDTENIEQALIALERAVELTPTLSESRANLGNVYLKMGYTRDAIAEYQKAIRINPKDAKTHNNLANAYMKQEWFNKAINEFLTAIKLDSEFIEAYKNIAVAYCKIENFSRAVSNLQKAISLSPEDPDCYVQFGDIYYKMENFGSAIIKYEYALNIDQNLSKAYYGLGLCYNKLGQFEKEVKAYQKALSIEPNMAAALMNLGSAYFKEENYRAAVEQYEKAIKVTPDDSTGYFNIGSAYSNLGSYEQAVIAYEQAITLDPNLAEAYRGLAFSYYKLEKYEKAWKNLQTAQRLGLQIQQELIDAIERNL